MTDTELKRRKAICEAAHVDEIDDVSDGFHTFRQLYYWENHRIPFMHKRI